MCHKSNCQYKRSAQLFHLIKVFSFLLVLLFFSCELNKERLIVFPDSFKTVNNGNNPIQEAINDEEHYQIITVIQGECPPCIMELESWSNLIYEFKELPVSFIFIIHARQFINYEEITRKIGFEYPVILDPDNLFMKSNFPENYHQYPTFLCKDFRIIAIGNPVRSNKTKKEFIRLILRIGGSKII